jgi:hypothetical protein
MVEIVKQILNYLISNYALYMVVTMSAIVSFTIGVLSLIKKPIKKLTGKIHKEWLRKLANKMFIAFAFGISTFVWIVLGIISPYYFPIDAIRIILTGAFTIVVYALGDGVITKSSAEKLVEEIADFASEDKKPNKTADENEKANDPVKEFWKKVK